MSEIPYLVIYVGPRRERHVCEQLDIAGFEYRCFTRKRRLHRKGKRTWVRAVIFPRYIFLRSHVLWQIVYGFQGVVGFLHREGIPQTVAAQVIDEIQKKQDAGEYDEKPEPPKLKRLGRSLKDLKNLLESMDTKEAA